LRQIEEEVHVVRRRYVLYLHLKVSVSNILEF